MARHGSRKVTFKRQVAQEYLSGETMHGLAKRHDFSRNLVRVLVQKYEAGALGRLEELRNFGGLAFDSTTAAALT